MLATGSEFAFCPFSPVCGGEGQDEGPSQEMRNSPLGPSPLPSPLNTGAREKSRGTRFWISRTIVFITPYRMQSAVLRAYWGGSECRADFRTLGHFTLWDFPPARPHRL